MSQALASSLSILSLLCCSVAFSAASPIDDGSYVDDDRILSRRQDLMLGLGHEEPSYRMAEFTPTQDKKRQAKSIEHSVGVDPSFVLSKMLYHMAQLPSV